MERVEGWASLQRLRLEGGSTGGPTTGGKFDFRATRQELRSRDSNGAVQFRLLGPGSISYGQLKLCVGLESGVSGIYTSARIELDNTFCPPTRPFGICVVVVVVVVEILRLHVLEVHPKPGPFHRVIWAMKPRQCIRVQFSAVRPISD